MLRLTLARRGPLALRTTRRTLCAESPAMLDKVKSAVADMKEKAESTLSDARAAEMKAGHESSPLSGLSPVLRVRHASAFSIGALLEGGRALTGSFSGS